MMSPDRRILRYRWHAMIARCYNPKHKAFHNYGQRGITVCDRWRTFDHFYEDMRPLPSLAHSLDRIDNDGPYTPNNCRWATPHEQGANMRTNRVFTHNGQTLHLAGWAAQLGIPINRLRTRLVRGCSFDEAISFQKNHHRKHRMSDRARLVTHNGHTQSFTDWARQLGINTHTLHNRLTRGWTVERALSTSAQPRSR